MLAELHSVFGVVLLVTVLLVYRSSSSSQSSLPVVNNRKAFEFRYVHARKRFLCNASDLLKAGFEKAKAFQVMTGDDYKVVLSPDYANEIRSHPALQFAAAIAKDFHGDIPGFEAFRRGESSDEILSDAVRIKLTQNLGNLTEPLSLETTHALQTNWTDDPNWHTVQLKPAILQIVAQLSSKVFLGDEICRNRDWLQITREYTVNLFIAIEALSLWPGFMRPLIARFLPSCRKLQAELRQASNIIIPVLGKRRIEKQTCNEQGKAPERYSDAMEWIEECAKGRPYNPITAQLSISIAAIHTTSDLVTQVLYDLAGKQDLIQALREEVIAMLREDGWKKSTLFKLKLMDSVLKETQRMKPSDIISMRRVASADIELSDGTVIPKDSAVMVSNHKMWDPTIYPNPDEYDGYRFLKLREKPGHETSAQLVSPSPEHLGFGFGKHACPGRFFATNQIKIFLCHVLLKYDFKLTEGCTPQAMRAGVVLAADPTGKLDIRRRQEEFLL